MHTGCTQCGGNAGECGGNSGECGGNAGECGGNAGECGGNAGECGGMHTLTLPVFFLVLSKRTDADIGYK